MEDKADKQQEFIELRAKGNSFDRIANRLSVSKGTLITWSRTYQQEVGNMMSLEREAMAEQYKITRAHQLGLYGEQLGKVREEVKKRDLSDVPTEKLVNMEIKLLEAINNLGVRVVLKDGRDTWDMLGPEEWEA